MVTQVTENPLDCGSQKGKAKSRKAQIVARIARLVRQAGLGYDDWRYVTRRVRSAATSIPPRSRRNYPVS